MTSLEILYGPSLEITNKALHNYFSIYNYVQFIFCELYMKKQPRELIPQFQLEIKKSCTVLCYKCVTPLDVCTDTS